MTCTGRKFRIGRLPPLQSVKLLHQQVNADGAEKIMFNQKNSL